MHAHRARRRAWSAAALLAASTPALAHAHLRLLEPAPRHSDSLKVGPCGADEDARGVEYTRFEPGETITLRWDEYIDHPGWYRVSFDADGTDDFVDPAAPDDYNNNASILLDNIPDRDGGGEYEVEVTLPDITCGGCTIQVIQVMLDKSPFGDGNDLYYQCADVVLGDVESEPGVDHGEGGGGCGCASAPAGAGLEFGLALLLLLGWRRRAVVRARA
ncbi:MAG: lytic polysaccharide monooxygenase [Myxococcales bacterium]|nr:lytic polysaccharide monooxygenase [Myxococcales bacterium]